MDSGLWILINHHDLEERQTAVVPTPTRSNTQASSSRSHTPIATRERGKKSRRTVPFGQSSALRAYRGDTFIQDSIKYVVCLQPAILISSICSFPELDKGVSISTSRTRQFGTLIFPSGNWSRLWSRVDFADQPLKNCVNVLHVDIVRIWGQYDGNNVSYLDFRFCFICSTESVSVKRPIQDKYVSRCQRPSHQDVG